MKRTAIISAFILLALQAFVGFAQQREGRMTPEEQKRWFAEYRKFKHQFLTRELSITAEQEKPFFDAYDEMEDKINALADDLRQLEENADNATGEAQILADARALYEQKSREGAIEMEYFDQFSKILKPKQLLKLKSAERKFARELVKYRRNNGGKKQ